MNARPRLDVATLLVACEAALGCRHSRRAAPPPVAVAWTQNAVAYRGQVGRQVTVLCPAGSPAGSVWGTDLYSDDSSICQAALHSGRITAMGGAVTIQIAAGAPTYAGSLRNNVRSAPFGGWQGSFVIVGGPLPGLVALPLTPPPAPPVTPTVPPIPTALAAPVVAAAPPLPTSFPPPPPNAITAPVDPNPWGMSAHEWGSQPGAVVTVSCPPGGTPTSVWGTDMYTADSSICSAGVHAGAVTAAAGGTVTIYMRPGQPIYLGSVRNGVTGTEYGSFGASFTFNPAMTRSIEVPPGATPLSWGANAAGVLSEEHTTARVFCPPGGNLGALWGSNPYTGDSTTCAAAVHAGVITTVAGGVFTVTRGPELPAFPGVERNGVSSGSWGAYPWSYTVSP